MLRTCHAAIENDHSTIFFGALRYAFVIQEEKMILYYHSITPADDEGITRGEKCSDLISRSAVTFLAP